MSHYNEEIKELLKRIAVALEKIALNTNLIGLKDED